MPTLDLRPRSASELVDAGFRLLRRHYGAFVTLAAIAYVPNLVIELAKLALVNGSESGAAWAALLTLLAVPFYAFTEGSLTALASDAYHTGDADVRAAARRAIPRVFPVAGTLMLMGLAIGAGLLALILPGVYLACRMFTSTAATVLEGAGPSAAISRTWGRTRGRAGHVAVTGGLMFLLYLVLLFGAGLVVSVFSSVDNPLWELAMTSIVTVLVYPMLPVVSTLLYYDLRIRSEGYDLEVLSGQLDGAPLGAGAAGP